MSRDHPESGEAAVVDIGDGCDEYSTCSSNAQKLYTGLTTPEDESDAIVVLGYVMRNHADKAPGYDPPTAIHGFFDVGSSCWYCSINSFISIKACSTVRKRRLGVDKSSFGTLFP